MKAKDFTHSRRMVLTHGGHLVIYSIVKHFKVNSFITELGYNELPVMAIRSSCTDCDVTAYTEHYTLITCIKVSHGSMRG